MKEIKKDDFLKMSNTEKCKTCKEIINKEAVIIEDYLNATRYTTRDELIKKTGLSDRRVRLLISELKKERVVIYSSNRKGYRLAKELKSMSKIEREEEIKLVQHSLNECKSRVKQLKKQMRKYIAYLKKAEQFEMEEENINHIPYIY